MPSALPHLVSDVDVGHDMSLARIRVTVMVILNSPATPSKAGSSFVASVATSFAGSSSVATDSPLSGAGAVLS